MRKTLAIAAVLVLACACVFAQAAAEAPAKKGPVTLTWWDNYANLAATHQAIFDEYEAETGNHVDLQNYDGSSYKEALDLAIRSGQSPDILSAKPWGTNNIAQKYTEGVLAPMTVNIKDLPADIQKVLYEGYTVFDGKVYSFPTQAQNHSAMLWFDKNVIQSEDVPATLPELRELFKSMTDPANNKYAIALPLTDASRIDQVICYITAASGGFREINPLTGYYQYNDDTTKAVMQWFIDIYEDGSVHPASLTLKTRTVRERFIAGEAAFAIDGVWYPGSIKSAFGEGELPRLGVHGAPVLDAAVAAEKGLVGSHPAAGTFYISADCKNPEEATEVLMKLLDDDYSIKMAEAMDQPPIKTSAIAKANVAPQYVEACEIMDAEMGFYPEPMIKNPAVSEVYAEKITVTPNLGDIYIGYITGAIKDWKAAVDEYNTKMNAELDRAIAECQKMGVKVSHDDFIFPNFVPGQSYTLDKYAELK